MENSEDIYLKKIYRNALKLACDVYETDLETSYFGTLDHLKPDL